MYLETTPEVGFWMVAVVAIFKFSKWFSCIGKIEYHWAKMWPILHLAASWGSILFLKVLDIISSQLLVPELLLCGLLKGSWFPPHRWNERICHLLSTEQNWASGYSQDWVLIRGMFERTSPICVWTQVINLVNGCHKNAYKSWLVCPTWSLRNWPCVGEAEKASPALLTCDWEGWPTFWAHDCVLVWWPVPALPLGWSLKGWSHVREHRGETVPEEDSGTIFRGSSIGGRLGGCAGGHRGQGGRRRETWLRQNSSTSSTPASLALYREEENGLIEDNVSACRSLCFLWHPE